MSKGEAFEVRFRLELEASAPTALQRTVPTFSTLCETRYRPHAELHLGKQSFFQTEHYLATLMAFFGETKLTEIRDEDVEAFARRRSADGLRPVSVTSCASFEGSETSRRRSTSRWRSFWWRNWPRGSPGSRRGRTTSSPRSSRPAARATTAEPGKPRPRLPAGRLPREQARRPLWRRRPARAEGPAPGAVFATTGCRKGEVIKLKWKNVDLKRREIRIWPSEVWRPKNGKPREVPMSSALFAWLSVEEKVQRSEWVFSQPKGALCLLPSASLRGGGEGGQAHWGPHTLRHTFASMFLAKVPDLGLLAVILGHSEEAVTRPLSTCCPTAWPRRATWFRWGRPRPAISAAKVAWGSAQIQIGRKTGAATGAETTCRKLNPPNLLIFWSGKPDSNRRPSAWEADALPTELFPQNTPET